MSNRFGLGIIVATLLLSVLGVRAADEIKLPSMTRPTATHQISIDNHMSDVFSDWILLKDEVTGNISSGFGTPVRFPEFGAVTAENVEAIGDKFFNLYSADFNIDDTQIRLVAKNYANNRWYLKYRQYYQNMEVMFSDISVTIFKNGNIMSVGAEYYNNIDVPATPKISYQTAINMASTGISKKKAKDVILAKPKLKILPYVTGNNIAYKLVYEHQYETDEYNELFTSFVDAVSGEVLWRYTNMMHSTKEITVKGQIKERYADDDFTSKPFPHMSVSTGNQNLYTDNDGKVTNIDGNSATLQLSGKFAKVYSVGETIDKETVNLSTEQNTFEWNDSNSEFYSRSMYYHANVVYDYFKVIEPGQVFMDFPVEIYIEGGTDGPNAMSGGSDIYFINTDNSTAEMAGSGSVLYHEYGHSMNYFHYYYSGSGNGMINSACNEALADITSCAILDDPKVGKGVFTQDREKYIRNVDNNNIYPDDLDNDPHYSGQILAGALWDLYKLTDIETLNRVSHFAKYDTPDDANDGNSFSEWFIACLLADDDDGNMANGTPHIQQIIEAFDKHKIGISYLVNSSFTHNPQQYYEKSDPVYDINFSVIAGTNISFLSDYVKIEKAELVWSDWKGGEPHTVEAILQEDGTFKAEIPKQDYGSVLRYYINVKLTGYEESLRCVSNQAYNDYDLLFVGYKEIYFDDFETDLGWIVGDDADDATQGIWEIAKPIGTNYYGYIFQPEEDHTPNGEYCLITDNLGGSFQVMMDSYANGITSVISPQIDLSTAVKPILEYYKWMMASSFNTSQSTTIDGAIYLSNDDGSTWVKIDQIKDETLTEWSKRYVGLSDYMTSFTDKMRFKIVAEGVNQQTSMQVLEILIDDFRILDLSPGSSIAEHYTNSDIKVFPNPVSSFVNLNSNDLIDRVDIVDIYGNTVFSNSDINALNYRWNRKNTDGLSVNPGAYFIKIFHNNMVSVEKIMVD